MTQSLGDDCGRIALCVRDLDSCGWGVISSSCDATLGLLSRFASLISKAIVQRGWGCFGVGGGFNVGVIGSLPASVLAWRWESGGPIVGGSY